MVGTAPAETGPWSYKYVMPTQPYPGNLRISDWGSAHLQDSWSPKTDMKWCWNGISGSGKFTWEYCEADLSPFINNQFVRVRFAYLYCGGGTGYGWAIDDVEVRVSRGSLSVTAAANDQWELVQKGADLGVDTADAYSGRYAWLCHNPTNLGVDYLKGGIDNSLITIPITLERAKDARLSAMLKFNILYNDGRPPDGFRIEVSQDAGVSWRQLNYGVRSAWNVSGTDAAGPDGTSYTGVEVTNRWVHSSTLTRVNCDLSGWAGQVILLRFRVVTRNDTANHYQDAGQGFGGLYVDDVFVMGNTTTGRVLGEAQDHQEPSTDGTQDIGLQAQNLGAGGHQDAPAKADRHGTGEHRAAAATAASPGRRNDRKAE
jgi:hypothetical protein